MDTMRAAVYDRYGPPEVLHAATVPMPVPKPGEALVRVHAASVNGGELDGRAGRIRLVTGLADRGWPKPTGLDFAGEIAVAADHLAVGTPVWGVLPRRFGSTAEYVAVPVGRIAKTPAGLDLVQAAALPAVGTTAITALRDKARLRHGERLLVRGAAGGVGHVAVQLGKAYGAHVTALAGAGTLDFVRELGADEAYDYRTTTPADLGAYDVVLDTVGTELAAYRRLLTEKGRMVAVAFDLSRPVRSLASIAGSARHGTGRVRFFSGNPDRHLLNELARLTGTGRLRPYVQEVFELDRVADAHRALEAGGVRGKIVVRTG